MALVELTVSVLWPGHDVLPSKIKQRRQRIEVSPRVPRKLCQMQQQKLELILLGSVLLLLSDAELFEILGANLIETKMKCSICTKISCFQQEIFCEHLSRFQLEYWPSCADFRLLGWSRYIYLCSVSENHKFLSTDLQLLSKSSTALVKVFRYFEVFEVDRKLWWKEVDKQPTGRAR